MEHCSKTFCRLCLNIINDKNFEVINKFTKEVLNTILLKLDLNEENKLAMCSDCSKKMFAALNFKSTCLYADDIVYPYIKSERIQEAFVKENGQEHELNVTENHKICRLCMQSVNDECVSLQDVKYSVIDRYIPEVNFNITKDPVLCRACFDSVNIHSGFIKNCLEVNEKFKNEYKDGIVNAKSCIKQEEIEIKSEENEEISIPALSIDKEKTDIKHGKIESMFEDTPETMNDYMVDPEDKSNVLKRVDFTEIQTPCPENSSKDILNYKDLSEPETHKCSFCRFVTKQRRYLRQHIKRKHENPSRIKQHKCNVCDYTSLYTTNLRTHQLKHVNCGEVKTFNCSECSYKSVRKDYLKSHVLKKHKDPSKMTKLKCEKCDYESVDSRNLRRHQWKHRDPSELKVLSCDRCSFTTIHRSSFVNHQISHTTASEKYKCDQCSYETINKHYLYKHKLRYADPSQTEKMKCDQCDYVTIHKNYLTKHKLVHTDRSQVEKKKCDRCDYATIYPNCLKIHQSSHKNVSERETFSCTECDYNTRDKYYLKKHFARCHDSCKTFRCDKCDYCTSWKANLKKHVLKHRVL